VSDEVFDVLLALKGSLTPANVKSQLPILVHMILTWPPSKRFPVLDFIRCSAAKAPAEVAQFKSGDQGILDILLESAELQEGVMLGRKELETNALLVFRTFVNLFDAEEGRTLLAGQYEKVVAYLELTNIRFLRPPSSVMAE